MKTEKIETGVKKTMEKLSEKAAAIAGAVTGGVLHLLFGLLVWGTPGTMMGAYGMMYYGMMQFANPTFGWAGLIGSIILGAIVGAIVGYIIAASYNWGLKK